MKVNVIPDLHGMNIWKELVKEPSDIVIFLGDYMDSFDVKNEDMVNNLKEIIQYKKENFDKTILLYGNHEFHYLYLGDSRFSCSGFRADIAHDVYDILNLNKELFQNAYQINNYLFTHAGVQNYWFYSKFKGNRNENVADQLNNPKDRDQFNRLFDVGYMRWGSQDVGGIFWCDRSELKKPLKEFVQVVGHTRTKELIIQRTKDTKVYFCDYLQFLSDPLILEIW